MTRPLLAEELVHPAIRTYRSAWQQAIVQEVEAAAAANDLLVVGMAGNPFVKKARKALDAAGLTYRYLGYGSYFGMWKPRSALKMWSGWPTFPMVFVRGTLVGGANDVVKLIDSGEMTTLLAR